MGGPPGVPLGGTAVVWFRRDLRLDDNPALAAAAARHDEVVCLYVLDDRLLDRAGPHRRRQLLADLDGLDAELAAHGGRLLVRRGDPVRVVPAVARDVGAVYWNDDVTPFAAARDAAVRAALEVPVDSWWGHLVLPPGSVCTAKGAVSRVFTPFFRRWQATPWDPWPSPGEARLLDEVGEGVPAPDAAPPRAGGPRAAAERLQTFLARVDGYDDQRDRIDLDGTSELSADLRFGTLSPRQVVEAVGTATPGRAAFVRQLAWRDWYAHLLHEQPGLVDHAQRPEYDRIAWRDDAAGFTAWCSGQTGYPVVDANMRQLRATGWMHNRARMIVASFLVKDLLVDWRRGERWFRHWLTDADVPQNAGNWQWVAGTGPDAAPYFRVFNPVTQSRSFDPDGVHIRTWVPELAGLAGDAVHAPWLAGPLELAAAGVVLGETYPHRVVEHAEARDRAVAAYRAVRGA